MSSSGSYQSTNLPNGLENLKTTVQKRITTFNYLKESHQGRLYWLNTVHLTQHDLLSAFQPEKMKSRTLRFAILGMSLSSLLDIHSSTDFLRGLLNLLQEFDSITDDNFERKNNKSIFKGTTLRGKRGGTLGNNGTSSTITDGTDSNLFTPNIPFDLDYFQVLFTTCDILIESYQKILNYLGPSTQSFTNATSPVNRNVPIGFPSPPLPNSIGREKTSGLNSNAIDIILKIDARLKKLIAAVTKDIDTVARSSIKDELALLGGGAWANVMETPIAGPSEAFK